MPLDPRIPLSVIPPAIKSTSQINLEIAKEREAEQQQQMNALKLQEAQQTADANKMLDAAYAHYVKSDGMVDYNGLANEVAKTHGHLVPVIQKAGLEFQEATTKAHKAAAEAESAQADLAGSIGAAMQDILDKGGTLEDAAGYGVAHLSALRDKKLIDPDNAASITAQLNPSNPDQVKRTIAAMRSASEKQTRLDTERLTANRPTNATLAVAAAKGDTDAQAALDLLKPPTEKGIQSKSVLLDGKPAEINFNPAGGKWEFNGQEVDPRRVRPMPPASVIYPKPPGEQPLVKVEHKDPTTGRTVIEYLPKSEIRGKVFEKGTGATLEARLASAQAVQEVGEQIIRTVSDPATAAKIGPAMGRYNSVREWLGNPPPELSELAGEIESYSLAQMGVHGMRSVQGSREIAKLLDQKHTPQSLIGAVKGFNTFTANFLKNEGRPPTTPTESPSSATPKRPRFNPATGKVEAQ